MENMLYECNYLEYINLCNFESKKVTTTQAMFSDWEELKEADLSNFNKEIMESMINMFYGCGQLEKVSFLNPMLQKLILLVCLMNIRN